MTAPLFIAGDWGTSNLRLALCRGGEVLELLHGPGISASALPPESVFLQLTATWTVAYGPLPALLCGMVGARNGWRETPYLPCPPDAAMLRAGLHEFELAGHRIAIVPGLTCTNPLGAPDIMRGEETQLLGALALHPELAHGRRLLALPGTHTKWAVVEDGRVQGFVSAPVGELFALLRTRSTLALGPGEHVHDPAGFALGLDRAIQHGGAGLHLIFETRSRQLREGLSDAAAMSFLSGLLIGNDVGAALRWYGAPAEVTLIGTPSLNSLYAQALQRHGVGHRDLDGQRCALAGLTHLFLEKDLQHAA